MLAIRLAIAVPPTLRAEQLRLLHQASGKKSSHRMPVLAQGRREAPGARRTTTQGMQLHGALAQTVTLGCASRSRMARSVEAAAVHLEQAA
ncbi:hypothetical protein D3C78_1297980 [compost metagenome]